MRDILITLIVFGSIPFIFKRPYIGILVWAWLSYMNPHRLAYGFAYSMPFAQVIAFVLIVAVFFNKDRQKIPIEITLVVWLLFLLWMTITTISAVYIDSSLTYYIRVVKIQLLTFITMMLMTNMDRINKLIWIIVLSIGFYSIKGGIFTILTGGSYRVWGPTGSFIEENNSLALAVLMIIPLIIYLYNKEKNKWIKLALGGAVFFSFASAVGSQSRGALLAIIAIMGFFWLKTKNKLVTGIAILILAGVGLNFMPESWHDRMNSIEHYEEDRSAMGRIDAWTYAINIANDRLTGGGFESWSQATYAIYSPEAFQNSVAHSIYFSVLADHGWIGLILFLMILFLTWQNLSEVIKIANNNSAFEEQSMLSKMLKVSMVAYMTGGAFLSLSYFDLPWHLIAISLLLKHQVVNKVQKPKSSLRRMN
jgi:putative inorganic carbon (HCO3(-)) transporter